MKKDNHIITICIIIVFYAITVILVSCLFMTNQKENLSTPNELTQKDIQVYPDEVCIQINNARISSYSPTGGMKNVLDENANGIEIPVTTKEQIKIGDILTYRDDRGLIVHRLIKVGNDSQGTYYILKGDNSDSPDPKVRFNQIKYKTLGIIF